MSSKNKRVTGADAARSDGAKTKPAASKAERLAPSLRQRGLGKTVDESAVVMARTMQPSDANVAGNVHGGVIMRLVDEAGGAVAVRHSRLRCVTVAMDSMTFKQPVYIGDLLTTRARLTSVGRTSMEVEVQIEAEDLRTGQVRDAGTSYVIYVALDDEGRPTPVPPLILRTTEERSRAHAAQQRRQHRQPGKQAAHERTRDDRGRATGTSDTQQRDSREQE